MRLTVVTASLNQGQYLEQTIQSVLNQTLPDIEYMILDAGSTDGSLEIIEKYKDRLAYWHSKPDRGFAAAINQGWNKASGDILCYLNSDDLLRNDALANVVEIFDKNPDVDFVYGDAERIDGSGKSLGVMKSSPFEIAEIFSTWQDPIRQPSAFFKRNIFQRFGGLDESFQFCADFEYFVRISSGTKFLYTPAVFSSMRAHSAAKSTAQQDVQARELIRMYEKFRTTAIFLNSGVSEVQSQKELYRVTSEHFLAAGKKWNAFQSHLKYSRLAYSGVYRAYRIVRYMARLATT
jgi:glycosyltransferase involved in cell wall biosynthesis